MTAKEYLMLTDILLNRIKQKEEEIEMNYDEIRDCKVTMSDGTETVSYTHLTLPTKLEV